MGGAPRTEWYQALWLVTWTTPTSLVEALTAMKPELMAIAQAEILAYRLCVLTCRGGSDGSSP